MTTKPSTAADSVLQTLIKSSDPPVRRRIQRRYENMVRELKYMHEQKKPGLLYLLNNGWFEQKICVLFALNCVYQELFGPLQLAAKTGQLGVAAEISIVHGTTAVNKAFRTEASHTSKEFSEMIHKLGFQLAWMGFATCSDTVFHLEQFLRHGEADAAAFSEE